MKEENASMSGGVYPYITYSYLSGNDMGGDPVSYDLPEVDSPGFYESFENFISFFVSPGWDGCYYVVKDRGVFCGNYSGDVMKGLVDSYNSGGLFSLQERLISSDLFFNTVYGYISSNADGGYTNSGRALYSRFERYDWLRQQKVDAMLDRLNDWSNGKVDEALDNTSDVLRGLISEDEGL